MIQCAIWVNAFVSRPRAVPAEVPNRSPLVHHADAAIRSLVDNHSSVFSEMERLLKEPFAQTVLTTITAFHAFTRYAWIDGMRGGNEEIRFTATVFGLQQLHLA